MYDLSDKNECGGNAGRRLTNHDRPGKSGGDGQPAFEVKPANHVARVRHKLGLPQTKFARLLGISEDTLQNWEQGRRKPAGPAKVLLKIAAKHPRIVLESVG